MPTIIHFPPDTITITPHQIARYAGGAKYRIDSGMRDFADAVIDQAMHLVNPAIVYAVHSATDLTADGVLLLGNGISVMLPPRERNPLTRILVALVGTIGLNLETACGQLTSTGDSLRGLFLSAAGTAALDSLSNRACEHISEFAESQGLSMGCRFAPGYMGMDMSAQATLFGLVDGASIGVRLNRHMVMQPGKSFSFFIVLSEGRAGASHPYKCQECPLKGCNFRLVQK